MGTVFLANQLSMNRDVALKVLKAKRLEAPGAIGQVPSRGTGYGQPQPPEFDSGPRCRTRPSVGPCLLHHELCAGPNPHATYARQGFAGQENVLRIIYEVASGLGHAHSKGLVHRDLKPDNIIITRDGHAKVTDLGLVYDRLSGQNFNSNRVLSIVGTTEYSAPEQHRNPNWAEPASDVFCSAAACIMHAPEKTRLMDTP